MLFENLWGRIQSFEKVWKIEKFACPLYEDSSFSRLLEDLREAPGHLESDTF